MKTKSPFTAFFLSCLLTPLSILHAEKAGAEPLVLKDKAKDYKTGGNFGFTKEVAAEGMDFIGAEITQLSLKEIHFLLKMSKPILNKSGEYYLRVSVNVDNDDATGFQGWTPGEDSRIYLRGKNWSQPLASNFGGGAKAGNTLEVKKVKVKDAEVEFVIAFKNEITTKEIGVEMMTMTGEGENYVCLDSLTEEKQIKIPIRQDIAELAKEDKGKQPGLGLGLGQDWVELQSANGKALTVRILSVEGDKVTFVRKRDGKQFKQPTSALSQKSQELVEDWAAARKSGR